MNIAARIMEETRQEFLVRLDDLYASVRQWVTEMDPVAQFEYGEETLNEESLGEYQAPTLTVQPSRGTSFSFIPVGCRVIAAEAWVDIISVLRKESLLYLNAEHPGAPKGVSVDGTDQPWTEGWIWAKVGTKGNYAPFTKNVLATIVDRVSGWPTLLT